MCLRRVFASLTFTECTLLPQVRKLHAAIAAGSSHCNAAFGSGDLCWAAAASAHASTLTRHCIRRGHLRLVLDGWREEAIALAAQRRQAEHEMTVTRLGHWRRWHESRIRDAQLGRLGAQLLRRRGLCSWRSHAAVALSVRHRFVQHSRCLGSVLRYQL